MALSVQQERFPEPDGPVTVFVAVQVGGVRFNRALSELIEDGVQQLTETASREGVTLTGKPRFRRVEIGATGDIFLMGEQDWQ